MDSEVISVVVAVLAAGLSTVGLEWVSRLIRPRTHVKVQLVTSQDLEELENAILERRTVQEPDPAPSPAAIAEAMAILEQFGRELTMESSRLARRYKAEHPSADHVREAASNIGLLRSRAGVLADVSLGVGGILLGAAAAYQVNLLTGGIAAEGSGTWAAIALGTGVALFVGGALTKWHKR